MIRNAQPSQYRISGNTNTRGRSRSPLLELYTQTVFGGAKKKSAQSFCRLRRQTALGV
jgi:hypothetical protein